MPFIITPRWAASELNVWPSMLKPSLLRHTSHHLLPSLSIILVYLLKLHYSSSPVSSRFALAAPQEVSGVIPPIYWDLVLRNTLKGVHHLGLCCIRNTTIRHIPYSDSQHRLQDKLSTNSCFPQTITWNV